VAPNWSYADGNLRKTTYQRSANSSLPGRQYLNDLSVRRSRVLRFCEFRLVGVWSKNSSGAPVVFQQASEAFSTGDGWTAPNARVIVRREQQEVVFTLVIPLGVVVLGELS
jgi:hypothetical protein